MAMASEAWTALAVVALTAWIIRVFVRIIWEPLRLRRIMAKQGVHGPPFRPLVGNLLEAEAFRNSQPEIVPFDYSNHSTVAPQHALYRPKYGKRFVYCWGSDVRLAVGEPEFAKQVFLTQNDSFTRPSVETFVTSEIVGRGVFTHEGPKWAIERRTLDPFFHTTALKGMAQAMMNAAGSEIKEWEKMVVEAGGTYEMDVEPQVHTITGKVITYTAFTSAEFERANQIYQLQAQIATGTMKALRSLAFWIPGSRTQLHMRSASPCSC
jgi:cytokinin trans-hydroxylase